MVESVTAGGCEVNMGYTILQTISSFARKYPSVHLNMMSVSNASIPGLVETGAIEIGFYFTLQEQGAADHRMAYLFQEPVCMMASKKHPLAGKEHLRYEDLRGCSFAFPHDDCLFVLETLRRIRTRGVQLEKTSYLGGVQLVLDEVTANDAIAIMPRSGALRAAQNDQIILLQMDEPPVWVWETLIYKDFELLKPAAKSLLRYCIQDAKRKTGSAPDNQIRTPVRTFY